MAHEIQALLDVDYPDAATVVVVWDHLNTHTPASLYKAFEPADARRLLDRREIHYTPKHASWLDVAEPASRVSLVIPCGGSCRRTDSLLGD